jgi:hypothetical protein
MRFRYYPDADSLSFDLFRLEAEGLPSPALALCAE